MLVKSLYLNDFKNIESAALVFSPKVNCFLGDNGMGKSNLLDALYFLSFAKSFTGAQDSLLVRRGVPLASLRGEYFRRGLDEEITAALRPGMRKVFKRGGKQCQRLAEHIGAFPLVLLSPADIFIITGDGADRRRFVDQIICQSDNRYLDALMRYQNVLEQRNRLLKDENSDDSLFEVLEFQLENAGNYISGRRREVITELRDIFAPYYAAVAGNDEVAGMEYVHTDYPEGLAVHLAAIRPRDRILKHTSAGPHRDDIEFTIDGMSVRRAASQGQSKTFTTALRFAQYELLRKSLGMKPLLLLDDIFDKLDAGRVRRIMNIVGSSDSFGQIFITDTNRKHLDEIVADIPGGHDNYRLWIVERGVFNPVEP